MPRLSAEALKAKIAALQRQLVATENEKAPAIRKVRALMKKLGVTVADLAEKPAAQKNGKATPKGGRRTGQKAGRKIPIRYRDTAGNAWTGRGKTPKWLAEAEKQGQPRESFRVT
jgi:DNA-binding protein H-NS